MDGLSSLAAFPSIGSNHGGPVYRPTGDGMVTPSDHGTGAALKTSELDRYPSPTFYYDGGAHRLVMVFRDPDTGTPTEQVPSEAVLRTYEAAIRRLEKLDRATLGTPTERDDNGGVGPNYTEAEIDLEPGVMLDPPDGSAGADPSVARFNMLV